MVSAPFYSDKDLTLIKEAAPRDYLGLLPIWSKVARQLEPHLSAAIYHYRGLSAVLFIYHLAPLLQQSEHFRTFFKYMELLVEYFIHYELERPPCFGRRLLNSSAKEQLTISLNSSTIANGLFQFYRGSCRRAKMLSADSILEPHAKSILENLNRDHQQAITSLVTSIEKHINNKVGAITPYQLLQDPAINALFKAVFCSTDLVKYFRSKLFASEDLKYYGQVCHLKNRRPKKGLKILDLAQAIKSHISHENPNWAYRSALDNVLNCEPFLVALNECFQLLHINDGKSFASIDLFSANPDVAAAIETKARLFLRLADDPSYQDGRFKQLLALASQVVDHHYQDFLRSLAQYHQQIMNSRRAESLLLVENDIVRSLVNIAPHNEKQIKDHLLDVNASNSGYHIRTTARIYKQLYIDQLQDQGK